MRICSRLGAWILTLVMLTAGIAGCGGAGAGTAGTGASTQDSTGGPASAAGEATGAGQDSSADASGEKALTLMLYLCGSDLESKAGAASADLEEILASGVNLDKVNIAVMAGGTTKWTNGFSEEETAVYKAVDPSGTNTTSGTISETAGSVGSAAADAAPAETVASKAASTGDDTLDKSASLNTTASTALEAGADSTRSRAASAGSESTGEAAGSADEAGVEAGPPQGWEKMKTFSSPEQAEAPANMGEKDTLKAFLDYSHAELPAQKYALIMWDHGGGPMRGLCWDTAWAKDNLTMEEFTGALSESPFSKEKLSWIGFDACLMSSVETAHLVSPYAEYMIASEETEPSLGWSYSFLEGIEKDENGGKTGPRIVDAFFEAAEKENVESALTLSCTDLAKVQAVEQNLDSFFGKLSGSLDAESFSELSNMRQDTREFGKAMDDSQRLDLVDLGDLVKHYSAEAPAEAEALSGALEEMVLYNRSSIENCTGLSSYHPYYNKTYYEKVWQKEYGTFNFAPSYTDYINNFAKIWMGDAMGDWTQMSRVRSAGTTQDIQYFSVQLTPEQMTYYASGQLLVLSTAGDEDSPDGIGYSQVYLSDDVEVDENGVLTAGYNGRTLYAVDDNGDVIAGPLNYNISDDGNLQVFGNYVTSESGAAQSVVHAMFECADAASGEDLQVLDQYVFDEDANVWSNRLRIDQQDYQRLLLLHDYKAMTYDGDRLLAFSQWEDSGWMGGFEIYLPNSFHFRFFDRNLEGEDLFACFQISDTQANMYGTDLMPVENPDVTDILFEEGSPGVGASGDTESDKTATGDASGETESEETSVGGEVFTLENDLFRVTLQGEVNHSENSKLLELRIRLENKSDRILSLTASNGLLLSDGSRRCICHPSRGGLGFYQLEPGEKETRTVEFSGLSLGKLEKIDRIYLPMKCELKEVEKEDDSAAEGGTDDTADASEGSTEAAAGEDSGQDQESEIVIDLHPLNLDLTSISAFAGENEEETGLAETVQDTLHWTLLDINQKQNGDLTPVLLCKNEGTETKVFAAPGSASVNGFVLNSYVPSYMEQITLDPGTEAIFFMDLYNRQYAWGYYDHLSGSQHLAVADVLRSEGMDSVRTLTLLPARMYSFEDYPDENVDRMPLQFSLNRAVEIHHKSADNAQSPLKNEEDLTGGLPEEMGESGSGQEEASAEGAAELTPEAMTRALDAGGKALSRTELFSENGVTVYGEHLLVVDRTISGSFLIENETEEDVKIEFDNWEVNGGKRSSWEDEYISYAGTKMRVFLDHTASEPEETEDQEGNAGENPDLLKEASLTIRKETYRQEQAQDMQTDQGTDQNSAPEPEQALPSVYVVTLSFEDGTAFNVDGGITTSFDGIRTSVECITEKGEKDSIFDPEVSCPEDPLQYKRSFSFTLPETLTKEQRDQIGGVNLWIVRDFTEQMKAAGVEGADLCLQNLAGIAMKPDEGNPDTYTADYAGLVCVLGDDHEINIATIEDTSRAEETRFAMLGAGSLCSWTLKTDPLISSSNWLGYNFDVRISVYNEEGTGKITDFIIDDEDETEKVSTWPLSWFETMNIELGAPTYTRKEDGTLEYRPNGIYTGEKTILLEEGPVKLDMIPATEFSEDIRIQYAIWFDDGSSLYYEGGEY